MTELEQFIENMKDNQPTPPRVVDRRSSSAPVPKVSPIDRMSASWQNLPYSEKQKIHEDKLEALQKKKDYRLLRGIAIGCGLVAAIFFALISIFWK